MTTPVSIHNSLSELKQTPDLVRKLGFQQKMFRKDGESLPYCQYVCGASQSGRPALLIFLHGIGSVGEDNFLQVRIPAPPLTDYCRRHHLKAVLLFPQCPKGSQWVDVPWNTMEHTMPEEPSRPMRLAMALLNEKIREFDADPARIAGAGISMGGYGIWDMACRMPHLFTSLAVLCGGADVHQAPKLAAMRIFMIHGDEDPAVPVHRARSMYRALKEAGCKYLIYRELPGVEHNVWDPFFQSDEGMDHLFFSGRS